MREQRGPPHRHQLPTSPPPRSGGQVPACWPWWPPSSWPPARGPIMWASPTPDDAHRPEPAGGSTPRTPPSSATGWTPTSWPASSAGWTRSWSSPGSPTGRGIEHFPYPPAGAERGWGTSPAAAQDRKDLVLLENDAGDLEKKQNKPPLPPLGSRPHFWEGYFWCSKINFVGAPGAVLDAPLQPVKEAERCRETSGQTSCGTRSWRSSRWP